MYRVEEATEYGTDNKFWQIRPRYLAKSGGGPWPTLPRFKTEAEAKAFAAILDCAHADGVRHMKEAMRELFDLSAVDHDH